MVSLPDAGALVAAGIAAGTVNTVAGAGSLVSWPVMLAVGVPAVHANVANTLGLLPGSLSGLYGYRRHLPRDRRLLVRVSLAAVIGAAAGGGLLLLSTAQFPVIAAVLLLVASALVCAQPRLSSRSRMSGSENTAEPGGRAAFGDPCHRLLPTRTVAGPAGRRLYGATLIGSLYSGYFAAGLGLVLMAAFSATLPGASLQQVNALKMLAGTVITVSASLVFVAGGVVSWAAVAALGAGSLIGGRLGAWIGPKLRPGPLRGLAAGLGVACAISLVL